MSGRADTTGYHPGGTATAPGPGIPAFEVLSDATSERRVVTILFCDVAGSTAMAEVLDPEDWADVMSQAFSYLIRPIERYGGTVARLMGDAVLALFGAPQAHEDDPQRAILAALEIVREIQPLRERLQREYGLDFNVRIGINTGLVVVGTFGVDDAVEYTAMGDAINVAARLEQMAEPGTIQVGSTTYRLTAPLFDFEPLGEVGVRGKREPEHSYRVLGRKVLPGRLWDVNGRDMPFTGRDQEMATLRQAVDDLRQHGKGRIIFIIGEAGVGKSRIIEELGRYVHSLPEDEGMPIAWLENRVLAYESSQPYSALQQRFRRVFGIDREDPPDVAREKFKARAAQFPPAFRERAARVIERVFALKPEESAAETGGGKYDAEEFKAEIVAMVRAVITGWNPGGAFMLVGEDYHWADAATVEIFGQIFDLVLDHPVIYLSTSRPEPNTPIARMYEWAKERFPDHCIEVRLQPLSEPESRDLVDALIDEDSPSANSLRQVILSRSEGNPLFVEEIVHSLAEQGQLDRLEGETARWRPSKTLDLKTLSIPSSLQALLLGRIDRLPPDTRRTLQQASVLGRTFSRRVLARVAEINGALDSHLAVLMRLDMIRESGSGDDLTFRHALIQETAYSTILHRHRREFHRRAGETMEALYADRPEEFAGQIGYHYFEANDSRSIAWLIRAAEQAHNVYEPLTVIDHVTSAIKMANTHGESLPPRVYQLRGHAYEMVGDYDAARDDLQQLLDLARSSGSRESEWEALLDLGMAWVEGDYGRAGQLFQAALALARELGDDRRLAHSLNRLGNWYINVGQPRDAREAHQEAMVIFERQNDRAGLAETLDLLGISSYLSADFASGAAYFRQAINLFQELGDHRGRASSEVMLMLGGAGLDTDTVMPAPGRPEEWREHGRTGLAISREIGWRAGEVIALAALADYDIVHGEPGRAIKTGHLALANAEEIGHRQWFSAANHALGVAYLDLLDFEEAHERLTGARDVALEVGSAYWTGAATAYLAAVLTAQGELDEASRLLDTIIDPDAPMTTVGNRKAWLQRANVALVRGEWAKAVDITDRLIATSPGRQPGDVIPHLSLVRGQALAHLGQPEAALSELQAARDRAAELGDLSLLWRIRHALASLYRELGPGAQAESEVAAARAIIEKIAGTLSDEEQRQRFVSRVEELFPV